MQVVLPTAPKKILLIKPSAIGDVVHALPIWSLLRQRFPDAQISWLVTPHCAGILENLPGLQIIRFERRRFGKAWRDPSAARGLLSLCRELRCGRFDLVVDLQGLFRSAFLSWISGAPVRVGFDNAREWGWLFYTHRVPVQTMEQHAIDRYLLIAEALGCEKQPVQFPLISTPEDERAIDGLAPHQPFAVLLPGTNWPTKRWPVEQFAALVRPLRERFGLESVIAGGPDEVELAGRIPGGINLAGQTTLGQLVALLRRAQLVIANDSGPMHIAAGLGRPLVTIFGPTNHVRTGPYGRSDSVVRSPVACAPCYSRQCGNREFHACMMGVSVAQVMERAGEQLARGAKSGYVPVGR